MDDIERIRLAYSKRHADGVVYSLFNLGQLFMTQQLEKELIKVFRQYRLNDLGNKRILDVGCGVGWRFQELIKYGARRENLVGIDLLPSMIEQAKKNNSDIDFRCGSADALPFRRETFDIVMQFVMFTSILDNVMKRKAGKEMLRVLKLDGVILWYDYFISKPTNPDVKGIGKREIMRLFPNCTFDFRRVTLAPPIARAIAPYSFLLCYLLEKIPWLKTYHLVVIRKVRRGTQ
jgi:ubiquinone/menaquinone biosynthesis C-methylase UbiE